MKHFEDLWTECESLFQDLPIESSLKDLELKFALFKAVLLKKNEINGDEYDDAISKIFGELLFSLTQISMSENVNVYKSLFSILKTKEINLAKETYNQKK